MMSPVWCVRLWLWVNELYQRGTVGLGGAGALWGLMGMQGMGLLCLCLW